VPLLVQALMPVSLTRVVCRFPARTPDAAGLVTNLRPADAVPVPWLKTIAGGPGEPPTGPAPKEFGEMLTQSNMPNPKR